jgi:hypothetical protein
MEKNEINEDGLLSLSLSSLKGGEGIPARTVISNAGGI